MKNFFHPREKLWVIFGTNTKNIWLCSKLHLDYITGFFFIVALAFSRSKINKKSWFCVLWFQKFENRGKKERNIHFPKQFTFLTIPKTSNWLDLEDQKQEKPREVELFPKIFLRHQCQEEKNVKLPVKEKCVYRRKSELQKAQKYMQRVIIKEITLVNKIKPQRKKMEENLQLHLSLHFHFCLLKTHKPRRN